ncbi:TonB-dependent receptor plug domain-containing protein [Marinoscillum pacificum]|uniref:TonB-dependent receptor plug domain-containing protein n=1 Tax=Marinoscillum pacificum TaxID=392723 RepID=UPI002156FA09|nr:TonB-dependent receptor plug domain-containing protein [Marinoscillum pacificum]
MAVIVCGQTTQVIGLVTDLNGEPVVGAIVLEKTTTNATYTGGEGRFELQVQELNAVLVFSMLGFISQEISLADYSAENLQIQLKEDPKTLDEVMVLGKSEVREIEESGFNVVAIDARPYHNASINLSQVLDRTPGVKIQQEGGLGSQSNVTINGLSGRHVRFFIDGMPMDAMSSAFQINNLPVNLAERIEVYKGVVPVNFGSDALGGAVNIVTKKTPGKYIDASYSFGSFNTHMTFVNAGVTTKSGFTAQISAYQNYSDNNYFVDVKIKDFETNLLSKDLQRVRRFHDVYYNETIIAKIGVVNKSFVDQLLFGITLGQEYDEIQHPAYLNLAFGEKYQTSETIMPSFLFAKSNLLLNGLNFSVAANYNLGGGNNYDVSDKEYNWLGESKLSNSPGEIQYSDYEYKNNNGTINANLNYAVSKDHKITLNNVSNFFARHGDEKKAVDDYINQKPRVNNRNILGASFNSDWTESFSTSVFGKIYSYYASTYLDLSNTHISNFETVTKSGTKYGYGAAASYFFTKNLQVKANYELTARLPESAELFGEVFGFYVANFDLNPEQSRNVNLGTNYTYAINRYHVLNVDFNFFHRSTSDFIRRNINYSQGEGTYENTQLVKSTGFDTEIRYSFKDQFSCGANLSFQDPVNKTEGSTYYDAVMPNLANVFGNADATYILHNLWLPDSRLGFGYNLQFIRKFLYDYSTYEAANRLEVPTQWNHSIYATYTWKNGRYNAAVDCKNIFDADLYDNYSLQKPGRSFSIKVRYFFNQI